MSNDEDHSSIEDDFSASEDEWKPGKSHRQATEDESDDDDSDFEDDTPSSKRRDTKSHSGGASSRSDTGAKQSKKRKSTGTSLRTKLFNKYKPPPKTLRNLSTPAKMVDKSARSTAQTAKKAQSSSLSRKQPASDSDSSGDDYLVNPDELDLQSSFFDVKPSTSGETAPAAPQFDCNAGMQLTDSEDCDDDDETESSKELPNTKGSLGTRSAASKPVDLGYLQDFAANMEKAKVQYKKHKERSMLVPDTTVDVSSLLAMGEGATASTSTAPTTKKTKNPKRQAKKTTQPPSQGAIADTDSDWEEVEGDDQFASLTHPSDALANGIQVSVDLPQMHRKDKKTMDVEATLRRQLNRIIKENQVFLHKTSLLCHIYHGLFLNKVVNDINLMPIALKLLPSNNVYPSGQTEIKYFQSMVTWFNTVIKIRDDRMYPKINLNPVISLAVQIKYRHAVCKRDFVLMFVTLLRAMGMQCRLVINMVPMPLKPLQSSLCSLKMKPTGGDNDKQKKVAKKENVTAKKGSAKKEPIKSPPLSSEEREELRKKVEILETEIKRKKKEKLQPKLSFEEELEVKVPPPVKSVKPAQKSVKSSKNVSAGKEDLKRKSQDKSNEPEKKKKVEKVPTKSPHFSESNKAASLKNEQKGLLASLESHSKSFDDQQPSISISSKRIAKSVEKPPKATTTRSARSRTETVTNSTSLKKKPEVIPDIVVVADDKQNLENITNKQSTVSRTTRVTRSRSKSPKAYISVDFLQTKASKALHEKATQSQASRGQSKSPSPTAKVYISTESLKRKPKAIASTTETKSVKASPRKLRSKAKLTVPQLDGADDLPKSRRKQNLKKDNNSEDDFQSPARKRPKAVQKLKKLDRQVLSPDIEEDEQSPGKTKINMWVEVYSELEDQWVCVDLFKGKVHCVDSIRKSVTPSTLAYVFAFNNDATMKDVTPRYCSQWTTVVRKGRVEQSWLDEAIREYVTTYRTNRDLTEDMELRRIHLDKPMPTTISEYKDNPLYALERHLLKFQAIYPPNALTLGFVRGEGVYARECVHTLHSREIWLKSARVVKPGEKPYKIVKARPKWDKFTSTVIKDQPLEIFGYWQTQEYEPPTAENGIVPRNAYGNVELFKECMLPKKTVHFHLPGLNKVCKKLGIDCVPAVIGFDFHQGSCHPLFDGFVVCEEFAEVAVDAWNKDQEDAERKEQEKYEARVYGNWKKLIRGLLIRERLKLKYNF